MTENLSLGFSPCPNDTFIFYGLVHNRIELPEVTFAEPVLEDVKNSTCGLWPKNLMSPSFLFMPWDTCWMNIVCYLRAVHSAEAAGLSLWLALLHPLMG